MSNASTDRREADEHGLTPTKRVIIDELSIGRCNPTFLIDRVADRIGEDVTRQHMNYLLDTLREDEYVRRIAPGLYELAEDPRDQEDRGEPDTE